MWHPLLTGRGARRAIACSLLLVLPALIASAPDLLLAQEGWDLEGQREQSGPSSLGPLSLGIEAGKPLILGFEVGYNFSHHIAGLVGFSTLSDFTAISGEMLLYPLGFATGQWLPSAGVGFAQYFLSEKGSEISPIAAHALVGIDYIFPSQMGVGANVGYQVAVGGSEDPTVERYGIDEEMASWFFAVKARYFF